MRVVFIGTGEIGVPTLRALFDSREHEIVGLVTQPDKPAGRSQRIEPSPIKKAALKNKLPLLQPERIKDPAAMAEIGTFNPDVIVVMAYGQILPATILQIPPIACLNLHASILPRWRGAAPLQAAILAGDRETGITVMYMNEGLDTGDILLHHKIDISAAETGGSLHDRLAQIAPEALLRALHLLSSGAAPRIPQDHAQATIAPKLKREDGRIDWSIPAEMIERKIRAFNPWPGAFTEIATKSDKAQKLKIFSGSLVDQSGAPREIISTDGRSLIVAAGRRALSLQEVQLEGKQRMSAGDFLRGYPAITNLGGPSSAMP
jgi:methionyl-tRNA formyltransferase